ncbi:MAG: S28 family serine protease [Dehalococcoidia bacterium]|nr:S28 family serine protease [Dehalococcoidia bacterium]
MQPSGAIYRICMPDTWNGDLMVWAHGYVDPQEPVAIPEGQLTLPDGTSLIDIATGLDFAFATTSYRYNGLVVPWGVQDVVQLVGIFERLKGPADKVILVGASEGGFITALAVENYPQVFDGGIAACGPVGDFRKQVDYFGDFRVVFDYFFPSVIPAGTGPEIPQEVIDNWDSTYVPAIRAAMASDWHKVQQLIEVTGAPVNPNDLRTIDQTVMGLLWYNVHATNDAIAKLYGNPYDNMTRVYSGSDDDTALNAGVRRFAADPIPLLAMNVYFKTTGNLDSPLVTLHTSGDPIVPSWHEALYRAKALANGSLFEHFNVPVDRYGHCNFKAGEALISLLILQVLIAING